MPRKYYLYRLNIEFPQGAMDGLGRPIPGWRPECWTQDDEDAGRFIAHNGSFKWPVQRMYRDWRGAYNRKRLFEDYGCVVKVERSMPVEWGEPMNVVKQTPVDPQPVIEGLVRILNETS